MIVQTKTLMSICSRISSGGTPSRKKAEYFTSDAGGHLWVKSKELLDCSIDSTEELISDEGLKHSSAKYYPANTVLIAMYGANVGQLGWLRRPATVNQAICGLIVDDAKADWRFVFYSLLFTRGDLTIKAQGAAQQNLNQDIIRQFEIRVPELPVQRRIAGILSAYDELIENNQRRIKILEQMARNLYREWFVHFRFPGHKDHPLVDSPLGEIPDGWASRFGDLAKISRKGIKPSDFADEHFQHFSIPAYDDGRNPAIELGESIRSNKFCIDDSCVLLSKLNPRIPRVWLPAPTGEIGAITSTEFVVLQPAAGFTREFVYAKCCSENFASQFANLAIGTSNSHQRVKPENLLAMPTIVPTSDLVDEFTRIVAPMLAMAEHCRSKIRNLRRTRDLLMPRLLSGQIDLESVA